MPERLYFRLPQGARDYFNMDRDGLDTFFDAYYLCALCGMLFEQLGVETGLEPQYFIERYPAVFHSKRELIAACLIDTEMRRQGIAKGDRSRIQSLISELTANNDVLLSEEGVKTLNLYAAGGFELMRDRIVRTNDISTLLVNVVDLLHGEAEEAPADMA